MAMERGLDVSGAQSPTSSVLLNLLGQSIYTFQISKATEGQALDITSYPSHRANAAKYNKRHGAYHFAWLNQDPIVECNHFYRYAALKPNEIGCLDIEDWGETNPNNPNYARDKAMRDATPWSQRIDYTLKWLREYTRLTGAIAPLYMNWTYIKAIRAAALTDQWNELCTYPLWLPDYDSNAPGTFPSVNPKVTGGKTFTVWLHQWTASKPANDGGLDGDACMDPSLWSTYAIPDPAKVDIMTDAQYADVTKKLSDLTTTVAALASAISQKANASDVIAVKQAVADMQQNVTLTMSANQSTLAAQLSAVSTSLDALKSGVDGLGSAIPESVKNSLSDAMRGFQVLTTMQFPTG